MTTKITSLSEIWEQYLNEPVKPSIQFTRESVQVTASNQMNTTDNAYNDMYKSSIFKKLWNHNIIHFGDHEVVADTSPLQKDMFAHLDDYPESEANTVIFNNGSLTTVSNWRNLFQIWSGQSAGGIVD